MTRTCRVCGKPELRPHRHGEETMRAIYYGRLKAEQERRLIRQMLRKPERDSV